MSGQGGHSSSDSSSRSSASTFGFNQSQSYLDPTQAGQQQQFQSNFGNTLGNYQQQLPYLQQAFGNQLGQIGQGGQIGQMDVRQLLGGGGGGYGGGAGVDMSQLEQFSQQNNPYLQQQVNNLGTDIDRQFGVMQQRLGGDAAGAGARGSSRQGIAESGALGEYLQQFQEGATNLRSNAYGLQQQAASDLAGYGTQQYAARQGLAAASAQASASRYGSALQAMTSAEQQRLQGIELGMGGLNQMQSNIFNPFQIGASVIGSPSTLQTSFGLNMGESESESQGRQQSQHFGAGFWS